MQSKISFKWSFPFVIGLGIIFNLPSVFFLILSLPTQVEGSYVEPVLIARPSRPISPTTRQTPPGLVAGISVESTPSIAFAEPTHPGLPVRIKIPKTGVDATLEPVGLTPQGAVDVPEDILDAGWYKIGPRPGEIGSSVITGHSGWRNDVPAVFDNLHKLQKGDQLYVEDEKGAMTTFVVREIRRYDKNADTVDVFSSNDEKAHLNLITCDGIWDNTQNTFSNRLVVFTDKETGH